MRMRKYQQYLITVMLSAAAGAAVSATPGQIDTSRNKGLQWLLVQQSNEGGWKSANGQNVPATALAIEALRNAGVTGFPYAKGVIWLANVRADSVDSLARQTSTLKQSGYPVKQNLDQLKSWQNSPVSATWGAYDHYSTSFPDTPLALAALRIGAYSSPTALLERQNAIYCTILPAQKADGGWSYTRGIDSSQVAADASSINASASVMLPTSLILQELLSTRATYGLDVATCGKSYSIAMGINKGVDWILTKRNADGGYGPGGVSNVIETALAYQVLSTMRPLDPVTVGALDYLISKQNPADGGWGGDAFQTAYVMSLFPSTALADTDRDGIPDGVESLMGKNPLQADSRWLAPGNGIGVAGLTSPVTISQNAIITKPFSTSLSASGGLAPYSFKVTSGILPPGLLLNQTTGLISGVPTTLGGYEFIYAVSDANKISSATVARINVIPVPPIPGDINGDGVVNGTDTAILMTIINSLIL